MRNGGQDKLNGVSRLVLKTAEEPVLYPPRYGQGRLVGDGRVEIRVPKRLAVASRPAGVCSTGFGRGGRRLTRMGRLSSRSRAQETRGKSEGLTGLTSCAEQRCIEAQDGEGGLATPVFEVAVLCRRKHSFGTGKAQPRRRTKRFHGKHADGSVERKTSQGYVYGSGTEVRTSPTWASPLAGRNRGAGAERQPFIKARDPPGSPRLMLQGSGRCGWDGGMAGTAGSILQPWGLSVRAQSINV
jgi:hypothetical protein